MVEHIDVLVIGAGISGISAGYYLQKKCPGRSYAILEGREDLGGTWDLFRYPGIRSDSDMYTLGYAFKPWTAPKAIADGADIMSYLRETANEYGIDKKIRYQHKVVRAQWSSRDQRWLLTVDRGEGIQPLEMTCNFLMGCSGYYNYEAGYTPAFKGRDNFKGAIVHPQAWPENLDYANKKIIVIGSGATAVTLLPSLAKTAAHVTMLQRSPTYVVSRPAEDPFVNALRRLRCPESWTYGLTRWKNVLLGNWLFWYMRKYHEKVKKMIVDGVRAEVGPKVDVDRHFTPTYKPWDQRLCLVPDGDLFKALREEAASVVTGHIDCFTEQGIRLETGEELEADIIVTATGLDMRIGGGVEMVVDGKEIDQHKHWVYKGMMLSDIPNHAFTVGYTNASWTLKVDLTCAYVCRLLNHMDKHNYRQCMTSTRDSTLQEEPLIDFSAGYIVRALGKLPKQAASAPWKLYQNYILDKLALGLGKINDKTMEFK